MLDIFTCSTFVFMVSDQCHQSVNLQYYSMSKSIERQNILLGGLCTKLWIMSLHGVQLTRLLIVNMYHSPSCQSLFSHC